MCEKRGLIHEIFIEFQECSKIFTLKYATKYLGGYINNALTIKIASAEMKIT